MDKKLIKANVKLVYPVKSSRKIKSHVMTFQIEIEYVPGAQSCSFSLKSYPGTQLVLTQLIFLLDREE